MSEYSSITSKTFVICMVLFIIFCIVNLFRDCCDIEKFNNDTNGDDTRIIKIINDFKSGVIKGGVSGFIAGGPAGGITGAAVFGVTNGITSLM